MAVEYDISSDVAVIKETGSVSQCARVTQMYSGQITYDDEAGSKFATATINGKSQRVMLCIAVNGTVNYDDVPSLYSTVDGHRCLNIVTPTETGTPDDVPSLYETVVIDGQNVRAVRCIMINKTPVYDGVSSTCTFTGDDGKTHTAQLVNKITGGSVVVIIKGTSPLVLPDAVANSLQYVKAFGGTEQRNLPDGYIERQYIYMLDGSYIRVEDLPISAGYKVEFDFQTTSLGSILRNYLGGRADGVSAGGGFRLSKLASSGTGLNRVVLYGFETGTEYYDPTTQFAANTRYKYTYDNGVCTLESGGSVISTNTFTVTDNTSTDWGINDYYFGNGAWSVYHDGMYVYSVKVWNDQGELIMDLVPAVQRGTVPIVGFYDRATGGFRTATGGTFAAGPEAAPTPDAPLDIISNNGVLKATHQSGLPLGYKLVDYIKADALIELDKPTNDTMEFVARFYREGSNAQYVYQSDATSSGSTNTTSYISSSGNWRFGRRTASINVDTEVMITSVQNVAGVWINGEQVATYEDMPAFTSTNNLRLFGTQSSPKLRLYWLKVYQNGAPFYDLVPCQRESDSAYGVYDFVSGQFFTNADATITKGSFVSDPVVARGVGPIETIVDTGYYGNLIDLDALTSGYYYNSSGVYTTASNVYLTDWVRVYNGDTITVYFKKPSDANAPIVRMNIFDAQKNWVSQSTMALNNQDEDVTVLNITADGYIRISGASNLLVWDSAQIIRGNYTVGTIPEYKAYVPYHTATCEDLFSIGDYADVQSIIDGVVTRNVGVLVLDGTENWVLAGSGAAARCHITEDIGLPNTEDLTSPMICSHYGFGGYFSGGDNTTVGTFNAFSRREPGNEAYYLRFSVVDMGISSATGFKNWLAAQYNAGTPVIVIYPLATPTTESVTGQTLQVTGGDNTLAITQAGMSGLELEAEYQAAVSLTIQEVEDANLDNNVEVTIS